MIPDFTITIFLCVLVALALFTFWILRCNRILLLHKLYLGIALCFIIWSLPLIGMKFTPPGNSAILFIWDAITNVGCAFLPPLALLLALAYTKGWDTLPRRYYLLFLIPCLTTLVVWTNPIHRWQYRVFSIFRDEIVFGPYMLFSGAFNYLCLSLGILVAIRFMVRTPGRIYRMQGVFFILGLAIPLIVSIIATLGIYNLSIAATPLSFVATLAFHGFAIYQLHLLDIKPIATQHVLDWISDCYLVLSPNGLVLSYNQPFLDVLGSPYGIAENIFLKDCVREEDAVVKTPIYNLITAVESCRSTSTGISYEQAILVPHEKGPRRLCYIVEITPLFTYEKLSGFVAIFKDITAAKKSMEQLQNSQSRLMEQERLAFLGQMVGGLAHNLKTPIMSISGCASAMENLVTEYRSSLGDPDVTEDDYCEICAEMDAWVSRIRESCTYMSDIISAIKGQAAGASVTTESAFTLDELLKRVTLLMRHELQSHHCQLAPEVKVTGTVSLHGDINNLTQVLANLLSNAVDAQAERGGGTIIMGMDTDENHLRLYVRDTGPGVSDKVKQKLFREMVTSKGSKGTGLGLYISNAIVRGKFGGSMWVEDNPVGGAVFGLSIPLENVLLQSAPTEKGGLSNA